MLYKQRCACQALTPATPEEERIKEHSAKIPRIVASLSVERSLKQARELLEQAQLPESFYDRREVSLHDLSTLLAHLESC